MSDCGSIDIDDIFDLEHEVGSENSANGSGSGVDCSGLTEVLRYSYIGGIGAIGILLLVITILLIAVCCLAMKLAKAKRYQYYGHDN